MPIIGNFIQKITSKRSSQKNDTSGCRAAIVDALNKSIEIFILNDEKNFESLMTKGVRPFAQAVGLDRVVFYRRLNIEGNIRLGQVYRWDKSGGGLISLAENLKELPDIPMFKRWIATTSKGGYIKIRGSEMAEDERAFTSTFGIRSCMVLPIFAQGEYWGTVSLQDHTSDRYFDDDCIDLLYSASRLFASAIIKEEMAQRVEEAYEELERREEFTRTLNKAAVLFLAQTKDTFEETMTAGVRLVADTLDVDKFSIWRNSSSEESLYASQIYRWDRTAGGTTEPVLELQNMPYSRLAPRWKELMAGKETVNGPSRLMPESEAALLNSFGILSHFVTPIIINNVFWGIVFFDDCKKERYFDKDSVEMMNSAAFLCVNAVIRAEMEQQTETAVNALSRREQMANMLNMASLLFLSQTEDTFENTITAGVRLLADVVDLDRLSVWRNIRKNDGLHTSQIYRWDRDSGGTTNPTPGLEDVAYTKLAPRWETFLADDKVINSPSYLLPEAAMLKSFGVISAFVSPIFFNNEFWGFVLLEDRRNERYFDKDSAEIMRTSSYLLANTVISAEMERNLIDAKERTKLMLDTIPLSCQWWDKNMNIIDCNNAALKLFGLKDKQEFFDRFFEMMPEYQPDGKRSDEAAAAAVKKAFEDGAYKFDWMHKVADGSLMPAEVFLERIKYADDFILVGYVRDLREQKRLMRDIEYANELNRTLIRAAPIGITIFDDSLRFTDFNDSILNAYGGTREQLAGNFADFSPEYQDDGSKSADKITEIMRRTLDGERMVFEWTHLSILDEIIPFEITTLRVRHYDKYIGVAFQYNLSSIKEMEKEIAEAQEMTRVITEASPVSYVLFDDDFQALDCNDEMLRLLESPSKQYFLEHYWDVFVPKSQPDGQGSFNKTNMIKKDISLYKKTTFEWTHRSVNGELVPVDNTLTQIMQKGRNYFITFKYDMRNTKKMMESIREQGELLKEALDKATAASKAKGEFLSNMSHEMRTPLNAIIGMTAIGINTADIERKNHALDKINDASAHLLGVINDILDMSKIEANMLELSPVEFHFERMLQRVVNVVNFRVEEKHQKFSVHVDKHIPANLIGDDQRLAQVITNLLGNAIKFTPEKGSISLNCSLLEEENGLCIIQISVKDTGIGISPEQQKRVFSSFEQAESSTTRKFGGTGLGLTISKNIVEIMGGKIWIESELNKGTSFIFTIKMECGAEKKHGLLDPNINLNNVRIMVVDDDQDILDYIKEIMQRIGAFCDTATGGREALKLVEDNGSYNIYFIDWKMPVIDGITLTSMLKEKTAASGNTVVIMISAAEWNTVETQARKAGVDKFLSKPLFSSTIVDVMGECLGTGPKTQEETQSIEGCFAERRILLAEDVEINREIVQVLLEPTQIEIDCAENGVEAVRMFSEAPDKYDLIFMDVQMPEMDGYEATRQIRALDTPNAKIIRIIAMTANVFREDIEKCLEAGMDNHLGKPLDFEEVIEKLHIYLPKR